MKLIYTNENRLLVGNVQNILEAHNIEVILKNEYSQGAVGELSVFDSWPELWILMDSDYEKAVKVIENYKSKESDPEWVCSTCGESNDASFDSCWKCQNENS
ncbi:DUF2007 domain-containing protein [Pseudomaricurvus alcaniphilus]|uniref:putative signal transducing protein n=1 Tax=Pseudomaricurvus alcaniphilus TaxID=1166482 RepID=UPI0014079647|nr:DUF2007 domain-containing protein [Pseudomaricurvus alcaniphilus]NHN38640.1 DUF2007 domain-containing protein [Pseudomaricurvus alcaniphilus]